MSLTIIAMTGIFVGFLCLLIGFFMDGTESRPSISVKEKRIRSARKRVLRRKAA